MQAEKKRAYLRTLPTGHIFPRKELEDFLSSHNMVSRWIFLFRMVIAVIG